MVSDDSFLLSQLDNSFASSYAHLTSAMQGFLRGWNHDCGKKAVVDKNRAWLHAIELLLHIEPEARLIVCLRELGQIYGSIEAQHQRTILVDFIDHLSENPAACMSHVYQWLGLQRARTALPLQPAEAGAAYAVGDNGRNEPEAFIDT